MPETRLNALVREELSIAVPVDVSAVARAIAAQHGRASIGVLFYGSCLRSDDVSGQMLDYYLIVDDYKHAFPSRWHRIANRLLPPNVYAIECRGMMAKYAVLSMNDFRRLASSKTFNVSVWARFSQPARLVWAASDAIGRDICHAVAEAAPALLRATRPLLPDVVSISELWTRSFSLTYAVELRAERKARPDSIINYGLERYERFTGPALEAAGLKAVQDGPFIRFEGTVKPSARRWGEYQWMLRRTQGKLLSALRLMKASTTFSGGMDYLAWKINRHAGTQIEIRPWQRRFPLIGALLLLPHLLKSGAVR